MTDAERNQAWRDETDKGRFIEVSLGDQHRIDGGWMVSQIAKLGGITGQAPSGFKIEESWQRRIVLMKLEGKYWVETTLQIAYQVHRIFVSLEDLLSDDDRVEE
jgi:hypothetical protein